MKININNKEYDAVEAKEITHFPDATDAITLDGITYNLTPSNSKAWKPEIGETYWYIESDGDIFYRSFENEEICNHTQQFGNYFKTEALATQARDAIKELLASSRKV